MMHGFSPPRGGKGSQEGASAPVPSAYWQPPEAVRGSAFWRYVPGGLLLGWADGAPVGVKDDRHLLTVAGARAGKTSTLLVPNLLLYEGSAVVIDPKGELAGLTASHRAQAFSQPVHVLDPWRVADVPDALRASFDPLAELVSGGEPEDMVDDAALMAEALIVDGGGKEAHWTNAARDFVRALILWLVETRPGAANLALLPTIIAECMRFGDADDPRNHLASMAEFGGDDAIAEVVRNAGSGLLGTPENEGNSILSTARNQLGFLEDARMRPALARSSFRLRDLKSGGPATVYLCLPAARMGTHAKWMRLFLNMTVAAMERDRATPMLPILFMLEEFAALGHMRALEQAAAYMAGFGVKLWVVLQDLTQLKRHYKEGWETFVGNAGIVTAFGNADQTTLDYLSKRLGETFAYMLETQQVGSGGVKSGAPLVRENFQRVPLLAPDEIAKGFGRRRMTCLAIPADGPPVALDRRHVPATDLAALVNREAQ